MVDVSLDEASGPGEPIVVCVILQTPEWELQVYATPEELVELRSIRDADWDQRRSLQIGKCLGVPVHWSVVAATEGVATILIGPDDETWEIAITVPITTVDTIVAEVAARSWAN